MLVFIVAASSTIAVIIATAPTFAVAGTSTTPLLNDDFTRDTSLNSSLWQINGPVGSVFGPNDVGFTLVQLSPSFSSAGMEIAQVNDRQEVGTIQSVGSFVPPFVMSAVVEGTVSNGHTFGLALSSSGATTGIIVYGNLNSTNCSHLGDCGDPSVCGTPANPSIPPNQCYYGIDAKVANGAGQWPHTAKLYRTPSVDVPYTIQISVNSAGNAQYSVGQGGTVLGQSTAQIGTGPFYVIMEQGEGSPVASPGPNQAYWLSLSLTPGGSSTTTSTSSGPGPTSSGFPSYYWILIIAALLILVIILWYLRRRGFTVEVRDTTTGSAISGANVTAEGPESLSAFTNKEGRAAFGGVKEGDYSVKATADGYNPSAPATIAVKRKTDYTVRLRPSAPSGASAGQGNAPPEGLDRIPSPDLGAGTDPRSAGVAVGSAIAQSKPAPPSEQEPALEGWGGERIREIIERFKAKGAISPETALSAKELELSRLFVRIMNRRRGRTRVFIEVNGKYYLNQDALRETK